MDGIQPIDSAFTGGTMELVPMTGTVPPVVSGPVQETAGFLSSPLPVTVIIMVLTIICIANVRTFANMIPSFSGCLFRWKENLYIEDSMTLSMNRNRLFYILIIPFCLVVSGYGLYEPDAIAALPRTAHFLSVTGVVILYLLLKYALSWIVRNGRMNEKTYRTAVRTFRTFFIIITSALLATSGILEIFSAGESLTRLVLLYEAALLYIICIIREFQIFKTCSSVFTAILYLCALEFLPTGILVATAIVL